MLFDFYTKKIKVFVAEVSEDVMPLKNLLEKVLERAGMEVLYPDANNIKNETEFIKQTEILIQTADCSIHLLGKEHLNTKIEEQNIFLQDFQFTTAQKKSDIAENDFKVFVWHPEFVSENSIAQEQDKFIRSVRQRIHHNMIFSNKNSAIAFVEDMRAVMYSDKHSHYDIHETDLFFIYNELDADSANGIIDLIADVIDIRKIEITLSDAVDYSELVVQQIEKSKFVVIYFQRTSDWAVPFIQQVWKKIGGASSKVPLLFIGDANIEENSYLNFEAPMVITQIVAQELIPIEIKVQYDKVIEEQEV